MTAPGSLFLVPNLLGAVPPGNVLPVRTIEAARAIGHWVVETPKAARAFLKSIGHPRPIAELSILALIGGALYGERRYGRVFVGHNGAQSYHAVRGFRGALKV